MTSYVIQSIAWIVGSVIVGSVLHHAVRRPTRRRSKERL